MRKSPLLVASPPVALVVGSKYDSLRLLLTDSLKPGLDRRDITRPTVIQYLLTGAPY